MRAVRMRFAVVVAASIWALGAAGAVHACINVHIAPLTPSAKPGDTVGFSISGLLPGAQYTVSVERRAVASGTSSGESASGSFTMPDLGPEPLTATIGAEVRHDDLEQSPWLVTNTLAYEPVAPPPGEVSPPGSATTPPPKVQAPPHRARPAPQRTTPHPATSHPASRPARAPAPEEVSVPTAQPSLATPSATAAPPENATRPALPKTHVRTRKHAPPPVQERTFAPLALERPVAMPRTAPARPGRGDRDWWPLAGLLLLLVLVPVTAAYAWRRRRPVPGPKPPDEVEAELQEIIAEERARALESRRTPSNG